MANRAKRLSRRSFLKGAAFAGASSALALHNSTTPAAESAADVPRAMASTSVTPVSAPALGYQSLSLDEAAFVEHMVNIMCPADHLTPNGVDCGLAVFIDRQLASGFGKGERLYRQGPWRQGKPELGYQSPLTPEQFFKAGVAAADEACRKKFSKNFDELTVADADAFLRDLAGNKIQDPRVPLGAWFNGLVYPLFVQACFADPIYGGNNNKIFWKMIGYPGLPATNTRAMVEYRGKPFPGAKDPKSIADFS
jgi:gluconate 2-dehydrogenase gamma chain